MIPRASRAVPWKVIKLMQIATINIPVIYLDKIKELVDNGKFESRSAAIRSMVTEFLKEELELMKKLLDLKDNVKKTEM